MKRRGWKWLIAAALAFLIAALLMDRGEERPKAEKPQARIPRYATKEERERQQTRRRVTLAIADAGTADEHPPPQSDPVLLALHAPSSKIAVVIEANAIRHSAFAEALLACWGARGQRTLDRIKNELQIDPLEDVDRIGFADDVMVVSGAFQNFDLDQLPDSTNPAQPYGPHSKIAAEVGGGAVAIWNGEMILAGESSEKVQAALDRLEGNRAPEGPPPLADDQAYGEVYGRIAPELLAGALEGAQPDLQKRLLEVAQSITLHADTSQDLGVRLDINGRDAESATDLAKSIAGALAMGRVAAQADHQQHFAELLDLARVVPGDESFAVEMALPGDFFQRNKLCPTSTEADEPQLPR